MELTKTEREKAAKATVYLVWYEDQFSHDEAFVIGVYQKKEDAEAHVKKRPIEGNEGWDGYSITGPINLLTAYDKKYFSGANKTPEEFVRAALKSKQP